MWIIFVSFSRYHLPASLLPVPDIPDVANLATFSTMHVQIHILYSDHCILCI